MKPRLVPTMTLLWLLLISAGCSTPSRSSATNPPVAGVSTPSSHQGAETPVPAEKNPPGDIPDTQQFVDYRSAQGGYTLRVPEGWARTEDGSNVTFADKLNSLRVQVTPAAQAPTVQSVRDRDEPELRSKVRAFEETKLELVQLPGGPAVHLQYSANSDPDAVTGKSVRLQVERFSFYRNSTVAVLYLQAPMGSDNVDVWRLVSRSFTWAP